MDTAIVVPSFTHEVWGSLSMFRKLRRANNLNWNANPVASYAEPPDLIGVRFGAITVLSFTRSLLLYLLS